MNSIGREILTVKKIPGFDNLRMVRGIDIFNDFPRHVHNDCCAGIITSGKREMSISGNSYILAEGDIFIINPGEPHTSLSADGKPHSYIVLIIPGGIINRIESDIYGEDFRLIFSNCIMGNVRANEKFNEVVSVFDNPESHLARETVFYSFIEFIARYHSRSGVPEKSEDNYNCVRIARQYIDENFREPVTLENISEIAGVSPFHLNRLFSSETGISPHSYIIHRRIESSKELLLKRFPISYVSVESGFTDQSHFTRFFKKITGTTPGRFIIHNSG